MIYTRAIKKKQIEKIEMIRSEAIERARKIAVLLKEKYGAKKVILFGSIKKTSPGI
jgi:hypothetical protein